MDKHKGTHLYDLFMNYQVDPDSSKQIVMDANQQKIQENLRNILWPFAQISYQKERENNMEFIQSYAVALDFQKALNDAKFKKLISQCSP